MGRKRERVHRKQIGFSFLWVFNRLANVIKCKTQRMKLKPKPFTHYLSRAIEIQRRKDNGVAKGKT
jgi:hypothetical protein